MECYVHLSTSMNEDFFWGNEVVAQLVCKAFGFYCPVSNSKRLGYPLIQKETAWVLIGKGLQQS